MKKEIETRDRYDNMNKVVSLYLTGETPQAIVRKTGFSGKEVDSYIQEYRGIAASDEYIKSRARETVQDADNQLKLVTTKLWSVVEETENSGDYRSRTAALKNIAEIATKGAELLHKVNANNDAAMAAEIAESEKKMKILQDILSDVTKKCSHCRLEVAKRLSRITGEPVPLDDNSV